MRHYCFVKGNFEPITTCIMKSMVNIIDKTVI